MRRSRHGRRRGGSLGRRGKPIREGIGLEAFLHLPIGPGKGAALVEDRDADHTDVAGVAILFLGVGFSHRTKAEGRNGFGALAKTVHHQGAMGINDVAALADGSRPAIEDIEAINRKHGLKPEIALIADDQSVAATFLPNDKPPITDAQAGQQSRSDRAPLPKPN